MCIFSCSPDKIVLSASVLVTVSCCKLGSERPNALIKKEMDMVYVRFPLLYSFKQILMFHLPSDP